MESSRQIEILQKVITTLKRPSQEKGLCEALRTLYFHFQITQIESHSIMALLHNNKPNPNNEYAEFCKNPYWRLNNEGMDFWWQPIWKEQETRGIRIEYIEKLIANIK